MKGLNILRSLFILGFLFTGFQTFAQIPISDEGTITETNCDNTISITDSNADEGNYLPGESYEMTVCYETLEGNNIQFSILPQQNVEDTLNLWNVDGNSTLFVYEGVGTDGDLIGAFNSVSDPDGVFFTTDVSCITFVWVSGDESSGAGFNALVNCVAELQPFNVSVQIAPPFGLEENFPGLEDENVIVFCYGDTLSFTANPSFPLSDATGNGYEQIAEECLFIWEMGDGNVYEGIGLNQISHSYILQGGFLATLTIIDVMGQEESYSAYLLAAPRPDFSNIVFNDTLCLGDSTIITGGILNFDTVGVAPTQGLVNQNFDFTDSRFLPDGNGEEYNTTIEIEGFSEDPIIDGPEDFLGICINMEHTYLGDLEAWLTCPDGSTALLFDGFTGEGGYPGTGFGGGGTFLGDANDDGTEAEGIGFDYCFADDAPLGTMEDEFNAGNTVAVNSFPPGGNAMVEGTYLPAEGFDNFLGCPVNGDWVLTIRDNIGIDNGYIFEWSMEFNPEFDIDSIFYSPDILEAYWLDDPDIVIDNDTSIIVVPSQAGDNAFTFVAEDSFGCTHDTTYFVYVRPLPELADNIACNLVDSLFPGNSPNGGVYEVVEAPTETAEITFGDISPVGITDISANEYGIYTILYTENNCGYETTAEIDFRPIPMIDPFFEDTTLCGGANIVYDAGPQEANSGNFIINWTRDGTPFNTEDLSVTVDQSGLYILTINGFCGSASDTSSVEAIEIEFEGDTICDLTPQFISVEVNPESIGGSWSADDPSIVFTQPDFTVTQIIPGEYGNFLISYTDVRCPDDTESRNFLYVQQPDITLLPRNPEICFEEDSLRITAVVEGSTNGEFFWDVDTVPEFLNPPDFNFGFEESVFFPPLSLVPLNNYYVVAETRDEFGVCVEPGRDTLIFEPLACVYNIPNVITPNDDNQNDLFVIQFIEFFPGASLKIFNRWGNMVFEEDNYDRYQAQNGGWDPEDLPGGVYFFELKLPTIDKVESGNITILTEKGSEQ